MKTIIGLMLCLSISLLQAESWILDSRFIGLDIQKMVKREYPQLNDQGELISHYSGYYNVNPFLLAEYIASTKSADVAEAGLALAKMIHPDYSESMRLKLANSSISNVLAKMKQYGIPEAYNRIKADELTPPLMDLPFNHLQRWGFNGVHTWTGEDDGSPMSSIDMALSWDLRWGNDTFNHWVAAATGGIATVYSTCYLRITHESGWATDYYHLDNIQVSTGERVIAGQLVANYANTLAQATCQGGHSLGPHIHFSLLFDGVRKELNAQKLSNWKIHSGNSSYDTNPARMWVEKNGFIAHAYSHMLSHNPGENIIDYRYSGIYSSAQIDGHGLSLTVSHLPIPNSNELRNVLFIVLYTYDDNGKANFYAGSVDFDDWRSDESKTVNMMQTSDGNLQDLQAVDFPDDVSEAGTITVKFNSCTEVEAQFDLIEPNSLESFNHDLILTQSVGLPEYVCKTSSVRSP